MGGLGTLVNKCQQRGNPVITVPEMPAHCFVLLRASGGVFGREKYIFGFRVINCMYWAVVHVSGWVWWGGLQRMGLDDNFPIGKVLPFWDGRIAWGSGSLLGSFFTAVYIYIIFTAILLFSMHLGRQEWVHGTDSVWVTFPK